MMLPADLIRRVRRDFPAATAAAAVLTRLERLHQESALFADERLLRCIVQSAGGDPTRIEPLIALGHTDPRDLIVSGEYDADWQQLRDLRQPFHEP